MKFTIAQRLWALVLFAVLALGFVGFTGIRTSYVTKENLDKIRLDAYPSAMTLDQISRTIINIRLAVLTHITSDTPEEKAAQDKRMLELKTQLKDLSDKYEKELVSDDEDRRLLGEDRTQFARYLAQADKVIQASTANDPVAGKEDLAELRKIAIDVNKAIGSHVKYNDDMVDKVNTNAEKAVARGLDINLAAAATGAFAILALGLWLVRIITRTLSTMQQTVTRIEQSLDLTLRVPVQHKDEVGATAEAFNRLLDRMSHSLKSIVHIANEVADSSVGTATTSQQIAEAAHQQSASASSMAASIEQLTVSITHVGERAAETNVEAGRAGELATAGGQMVQQTVTGIEQVASTVESSARFIEDLETQSDRVAKVVQVIQEVADQTNLLALNAAIEAARAGEQGRGFAVVADEVRKLAERTANSTREIAETINSMRSHAQSAAQSMREAVGQVDESVNQAAKAREAIHALGVGAHQAVGMVAEITAAIHEQSAASTSIAQSVERVAQMADESAVAAQNGAESAMGLDTLAQRMRDEVAKYTL
ncbi:methyl-accepting chemotaxis protein [Uliginosibacterium gangwonense]|uniref:methyl-accepting chemotaxis protein n=1 Tax=Uliginosibacterium gangwonense TaxID=392736 RepID=UPI000363813F|nr:methyl-accepting chemotaxis protein [Uliginosibacterium gangwonense]